MKRKLVVIWVLLSLLVALSNNVLAYQVMKDYELKTKKQIRLFNKHKKDPLKASLASIVPGGGHFYSGRESHALFYILENTAMAYMYKTTKESFFLTSGLVIKIIEMSSAYDETTKRNRKLRKAVVDFTEKIEVSEDHIGFKFTF